MRMLGIYEQLVVFCVASVVELKYILSLRVKLNGWASGLRNIILFFALHPRVSCMRSQALLIGVRSAAKHCGQGPEACPSRMHAYRC